MNETKVYRANNTFDLDDFLIREKEFLFQRIITDEKENVLEEITYREDGSEETVFQYQYDSEYRLIAELLSEDDETTGNRSLEYDENGRIYREITHYLDGSFDTTTFEYSEEGKLVGKKTVDSDGEEGNYSKNEYKAGILVSEMEYDTFGKVIYNRSITLNDQNQIVEEEVKTLDGYSRIVYEYNEQNLAVLIKRYNAVGHLLERITYEYDSMKRIILTTEENMNGVEITNTTYNEEGLPVLQQVRDANEILLQQIERTYDDLKRPFTVNVNIQNHNMNNAAYYRLRYEYA